MELRAKLGRTLQMLLVIYLVSTQIVGADDSPSGLEFDVEEIEKDEKISASLKIESSNFRNKTEKARQAAVTKVPETRQQIGELTPGVQTVSPQQFVTATFVDESIATVFGNATKENAVKNSTSPISVDARHSVAEESDAPAEELPQAQELRYLRPSLRRRISFRPVAARPSSNRRNVLPESPQSSALRPPRRPTEQKRMPPTEKECTFFTKTVCLHAVDYPHEAILRSIRNNKEMVAALLTDFKMEETDATRDDVLVSTFPRYKHESKHYPRYDSRFENNEIRRKINEQSLYDNTEEGFTCPSQVKYARPQLARAASGTWKYIINTGEHTQTLRLEKCSTPQSSCSFISENYRSSCAQVYNYHRLLTWDNKLGLHMDIFKVPTCCSCHVHGYAELFPPHQRDPPPKVKELFPGADFSTLDQKDELVDVGLSNVDTVYGASNKKPVVDTSFRRPGFPSRGSRPKKQGLPISRPYDKIPQQHAPNTRAPGYKGPVLKPPRPNKYNSRPFRRESIADKTHEIEIYPDTNATLISDFEFHDDEIGNIANLQNSFNDDYHEPNRRINYNYHPIIDFFKPEAAMLQTDNQQNQKETIDSSSNAESWKPIVFS